MGSTSRVIFEEPCSVKASRWLRENGYHLADCAGLASRESLRSETNSVGILLKNHPRLSSEPKKHFFGLITEEPTRSRRIFLGTIWFDNRQIWDFEVNGSKHITKARELAEKMAEDLNVKTIVLRLGRDEAVEMKMSDFDW